MMLAKHHHQLQLWRLLASQHGLVIPLKAVNLATCKQIANSQVQTLQQRTSRVKTLAQAIKEKDEQWQRDWELPDADTDTKSNSFSRPRNDRPGYVNSNRAGSQTRNRTVQAGKNRVFQRQDEANKLQHDRRRRSMEEDNGSQEVLPHRRRAAAARTAPAMNDTSRTPGPTMTAPTTVSTTDTEQETYPTFVPRNPGVIDGPWNTTDANMVSTALQDAQNAVTAKTIDEQGFVLLGKTLEELEAFVTQHGQPKYRAKQLLDGILQGARSLDDVKGLPKTFIDALKSAGVRTGRSILHKSVSAPDGTQKFLLQLQDGRVVETVGIPNDSEPTVREGGPDTQGSRAEDSTKKSGRLTVCVSSQVGCPMRCEFCATGKGGFARNLMPHEVIDQVMTVQELFGKRVNNVVFMGMGEPLLNLPCVVKSYECLNKQLGISGRSITVSTVGVPNAIPRLAKAQLRSTLAVSIHAPNQTLRESLIPSAKVYPIDALMKDCRTYFNITGRRVTFEYTLLSGVNDDVTHARELGALLRSYNLMSHVNLIPWNPVDDSQYVRPSRNRVFAFVRELEAAGLTTTVRITRGLEAAAACGQLRNIHQKTPLPAFAAPM